MQNSIAILLPQTVFNYYDPVDKEKFLKDHSKEISVPGTNKNVFYNSVSKVAVATSLSGASKASALRAHTFAINSI